MIPKKVDESEDASDEVFTSESFFMCCKQCGLTLDELSEMTIGNALDYQTKYVEMHSDNKKEKKAVRATQNHFDNF